MDFLIRTGVRILQAMFLVGVIGSALVLILAAISETKGAVGDDDEENEIQAD